jgi:hypothetical protein
MCWVFGAIIRLRLRQPRSQLRQAESIRFTEARKIVVAVGKPEKKAASANRHPTARKRAQNVRETISVFFSRGSRA